MGEQWGDDRGFHHFFIRCDVTLPRQADTQCNLCLAICSGIPGAWDHEHSCSVASWPPAHSPEGTQPGGCPLLLTAEHPCDFCYTCPEDKQIIPIFFFFLTCKKPLYYAVIMQAAREAKLCVIFDLCMHLIFLLLAPPQHWKLFLQSSVCHVSPNLPSFPNSGLISQIPKGHMLLPWQREACRLPAPVTTAPCTYSSVLAWSRRWMDSQRGWTALSKPQPVHTFTGLSPVTQAVRVLYTDLVPPENTAHNSKHGM